MHRDVSVCSGGGLQLQQLHIYINHALMSLLLGAEQRSLDDVAAQGDKKYWS
jgi:hypothetical protein